MCVCVCVRERERERESCRPRGAYWLKPKRLSSSLPSGVGGGRGTVWADTRASDVKTDAWCREVPPRTNRTRLSLPPPYKPDANPPSGPVQTGREPHQQSPLVPRELPRTHSRGLLPQLKAASPGAAAHAQSTRAPVALLPAHTAPLGIAFYRPAAQDPPEGCAPAPPGQNDYGQS